MEDISRMYKQTRVLVTGHTGFKGSWLVSILRVMGAEVCGYALEPPTFPNHFDNLALDIESNIGDIRDYQHLLNVAKAFSPDIIFHLAAQPIVRLSYKEPRETYEVNVMGSVNVLEVARHLPSLKALVMITSDKCYENREWVWGYRESDEMGGFDPYSSSKGCVEILTSSYRRSFFHPDHYGKMHHVCVSSVRAGNVIGGGDWAQDRLVPDIIRATVNNESVYIRNPHATRPWQHVLDPLWGYLTLGAELLNGSVDRASAWNFGPDSSGNLSVSELLERMKKEWEKIDFLCDEVDANLHEAKLLYLDCAKAKALLAWKPRWDIEATVRRTIEWYRSFYEDSQIITLRQVEDFLADVKEQVVVEAT